MGFLIRIFGCAVLALGLAVLAACETTVERPEFAQFTYTHLPELKLDVARIEFIGEYRSPLTAPHVEHLFPTPPADAVRRWVGDRLQAVGVQRTARVFLKDASAVGVALEGRTGIEGWFWVDQVERIDGRIHVLVEILDESGLREAYTSAEIKRSRTLAEDLTLNERDQIYFELTEALMNDFNATLELNIREFLGRYLR